MANVIMVVDDEPDFLYEVRKMLEKHDYQVITSTNYKDAYEALQKNTPDLILLDVMMPEVDGWSLARTIKEDEKLKKVPLAMLTVKSSYEDKIESLEGSCANWHITKPIEMENFLETVKWLIKNPPPNTCEV